ncbi:zinc-binding oxidoreductase-like protein ToxD [Neohortaea acidophila]|uniref:Zinc-binding oxidoreductase-like protein ToxD n=1 Tax=Neohortaea acidophila TaxID=245834 RepID=A0A6A6PI86_9PEZI|nr:zinc-binding oxidoreductase-like protein ToxD [Neohortaea acidophila]KAF2479740.1 zinc-binding oxidoreductase-like protein ToxD [Neohortaea acidophila]
MTMREAIVYAGPRVEIIDSPIPKAQPGQIVTKVVVSAANPKDWRRPARLPDEPAINQGDEHAGYVHEVGEGVTEFKVGDRVAALHEITKSGGSYAEYAVSWAHATFHLPPNTSFEEGATVPLTAMTAAVGLYAKLRLPEPWLPAEKEIPLVIYGASSAVGYYAVQLALKSNIHPLICVAGRASERVQKLLDPSKGDTIIDYRGGEAAVVQGLKDALKGRKLEYAYDAVSENGSYQNIAQVIDHHTGAITVVLAGKKYDEIPESIQKPFTFVGFLFSDLKDFGYVYFRYFERGLEEGWLKPQPHELVPGGLHGVQQGLLNLKEAKSSAVKYVFRNEEQ